MGSQLREHLPRRGILKGLLAIVEVLLVFALTHLTYRADSRLLPSRFRSLRIERQRLVSSSESGTGLQSAVDRRLGDRIATDKNAP